MFKAKSILLPLFSSAFIYFEYFQIELKALDTILGLLFLYTLFTLSKKELFAGGFITGVLWFWWLGYSFVYYDLSYLIPLVIIGTGLIYGTLFYIIGLSNNLIFKTLYIFSLSYIEPFGFNWYKIELVFINSFLGTSKFEFLSLVILTALFIFLKQKSKARVSLAIYAAGIVALYFINLNGSGAPADKPKIKIYMNATNIDQEKKWDQNYQKQIIQANLRDIDKAVQKGYDLIVFPETAFPTLLNKNEYLKDILLKKSEHISIITGALNKQDDLYYNSSYLFTKGKMQIANKVVLVPFGEAVPLPEKLKNLINDIFYDGAKDYEVAKEATTFDIEGTKFRNAICYEATTDKIYENLDTKYIMAISNNGWFTPSIQPNLQNLLLKYYARKYKVMIYSVANKSPALIVN